MLRESPYSDIPHLDWATGSIILALKDCPIGQNIDRNEVLAFLLTVSSKYVGSSYYSKVTTATPELATFLDKRLSLYALTSPNEVRGEWLFSHQGIDKTQPLIKRLLIFGDLITNPVCADNYVDAPAMLQNFSDVVSFSLIMLGKVLDIVQVFTLRLTKSSDVDDNAILLALLSAERKAASRPSTPAPSQQRTPAIKDNKLSPKRTPAPQHTSKEDLRNTIIGLLFVLALVLLVAYFISSQHDNDSSNSKAQPTSPGSANSSENALSDYYYKLLGSAPSSTATPRPVSTYNGQVLIVPDYTRVCPLEIKADTGSDYYIYLDYQRAPTYTTESRQLGSLARAPYESDIAFIVKSGRTVEVDVPIGVYKLYYATGTTFYGTKLLFGDNTRYYDSDDLLTFYAGNEYYNGHTITLYSVYDGNFDTDEISEKNFPTR